LNKSDFIFIFEL
jgi:secreted trypsin-like serine protease